MYLFSILVILLRNLKNLHFMESFGVIASYAIFIYLFIYLFIYCFLGLPQRHMEVPRLGVESELQLPAYTTATATWDPSHVCDLHHSSLQHQILNPLSEARD